MTHVGNLFSPAHIVLSHRDRHESHKIRIMKNNDARNAKNRLMASPAVTTQYTADTETGRQTDIHTEIMRELPLHLP